MRVPADASQVTQGQANGRGKTRLTHRYGGLEGEFHRTTFPSVAAMTRIAKGLSLRGTRQRLPESITGIPEILIDQTPKARRGFSHRSFPNHPSTFGWKWW